MVITNGIVSIQQDVLLHGTECLGANQNSSQVVFFDPSSPVKSQWPVSFGKFPLTSALWDLREIQ